MSEAKSTEYKNTWHKVMKIQSLSCVSYKKYDFSSSFQIFIKLWRMFSALLSPTHQPLLSRREKFIAAVFLVSLAFINNDLCIKNYVDLRRQRKVQQRQDISICFEVVERKHSYTQKKKLDKSIIVAFKFGTQI